MVQDQDYGDAASWLPPGWSTRGSWLLGLGADDGSTCWSGRPGVYGVQPSVADARSAPDHIGLILDGLKNPVMLRTQTITVSLSYRRGAQERTPRRCTECGVEN